MAFDQTGHVESSDAAVLVCTPVVSVCMITYNHAPFLAEAIESVVHQQTKYSFERIIRDLHAC